jgi:hypothetical protein
MAGPALDDNDDKPLDRAVERVRRKLVRSVAVILGTCTSPYGRRVGTCP